MRLHCPVLLLRDTAGREYLLAGEDACQIRLDIRAGTLLDGPVRLHYDLAGSVGLGPKLLTLRRLLALIRLRRLPRGYFPPPSQARRWMLALRAFDARQAGASHRDIAAVLFDVSVIGSDWGDLDYLRSRVQRLIRLGDLLVQSGYRRLLR
jgi:hypothetical protein